MTGDPRKRVQPGDDLQIPASVWNQVLNLLSRSGVRVGAGGGLAPFNGTVNVKNESGGNVARFEVLAITGVAITPTANLQNFQDYICLKGAIAPSCGGDEPASPAGNFVVMQEAVPAGGIGKGIVFGCTPVQVDVTNVKHRCCELQPGVKTALKSSESGTCRIIYKGNSTSVQWCYVAVGMHHDQAPDGCEDEECPAKLPLKMDDIPGFDAAKEQVIKHTAAVEGETEEDEGTPACWRWQDIGDCPEDE